MCLILLELDAANVSTSCDNLAKSINNARLEWTSTAEARTVHARTFPLQW